MEHESVKLMVSAELYGFLGKMDEIKKSVKKSAFLIEDAVEAAGVIIEDRRCGSFSDYSVILIMAIRSSLGSVGE